MRLPARVLALLALAGCSPTGGGDVPPLPDKDRVQQAMQVRLTAEGFSFLSDNVAVLLEQALPDGLAVCVPGDSGSAIGVDWGYCQTNACGDGSAGCPISAQVRGVEVSPVAPDRVRAVVHFDAISARLDVAATPVLDCDLAIDSPAEGFPVQVDLVLSTPDPTKELRFTVADPVLQLSDLSIRLEGHDGALSALCNVVDGVLNFPVIGDTVLGLIQSAAMGPLMDQVEGMVEDATCRTCESDADCPLGSGASCSGGRCQVDGACLPRPLGAEGELDVGQALASVSPGLTAKLQYLATLGSYAEVKSGGLSIGVISGAASERNRCVPARPKPTNDPPPRSLALDGNFTPTGQSFELGVGISARILEHFGWAAFNSGALCLTVSSDTVEMLNARTLGIALPNLTRLTRGAAPLAITLSPQELPRFTLGTNQVIEHPQRPGEPFLVDPLLTVELPDLWLDFHAFMDDRWVRLMSLKATVRLEVGVDFGPENQLIPVIGDLSTLLTEVETANGEIMFDDPDRLANLLPTLLGPALNGALAGMLEGFELPTVMGYRLDLREGDLTSVDNGALLALFANLERDDTAPAQAVETKATLKSVTWPKTEGFIQDSPDAYRRIQAKLALPPSDRPLAYSYQVDGYGWSPFVSPKGGELVVTSPALVLQGKHRLAVRAREVGDYRTLDLSPATFELVVDSEAPRLSLDAQGERLAVAAEDDITGVRLSVSRDGAAFLPLTETALDTTDAETLVVRATDEAGNTAEKRWVREAAPVVAAAPEPEAEPAGCTQAPGRSGGAGALGLLAALGLALTRRRRGLAAVAAAVSLIACDDNSAGSDEDDPQDAQVDAQSDAGPACTDDKDCPDGQRCQVSEGVAACVPEDCRDAPDDCEALACPDDQVGTCGASGECACAPRCPDGCGEGEYCCFKRNVCEPEPEPECDADACEPGFVVGVVAPGTMDSATCGWVDTECDCVEAPPLDLGTPGRFSALAVVDGVAVVSGYSDLYGDLVVGVGGDEGLTWTFVDGVPEGVPQGAPSGPRGGIKAVGDDVGRNTAIAAASDGTLHIAYQDSTHGALKYALGVPGPAHTFTFETFTLDDEGTAATATAIGVSADGKPGIAYRVEGLVGADGQPLSELRFVEATTARPAQGDWAAPQIIHARPYDPAQATEGYPEGTGLFVSQARDLQGLPVLAWYDRSERALYLSRGSEVGFSEPERLAGGDHPERPGDMGANVDVAVDAQGELHLCYQDGTLGTLHYLAPGLNREELLDDGLRTDYSPERELELHVVGEDCNVVMDSRDNPAILYQDATGHDLVLARRIAEGSWNWGEILGHEPTYVGAFGFFLSAALYGDDIWVSHYVYRHQDEPVREGLEVIRLAEP